MSKIGQFLFKKNYCIFDLLIIGLALAFGTDGRWGWAMLTVVFGAIVVVAAKNQRHE